jgi:hypothetical protein
MPTFRQRFTGNAPEDFPAPPLGRRLEPGDVVEYEADEPVAHARLELVSEPGSVASEPAAGAE